MKVDQYPVISLSLALNHTHSTHFLLQHIVYIRVTFGMSAAKITARKRYSEDSAVDDYLLNQISKWIICDRLGLLARDLGIGQAEFSRIQIMKSAPVEQVFQVVNITFSFEKLFMTKSKFTACKSFHTTKVQLPHPRIIHN